MKRLVAWGALFTVLAGLVVLPWLLLDSAPAIEPPSEFRRTDLAWVKSLFQKHDPRRQTPDMVHSIQLDEAELNRLLNYAVELQQVSGISAELTPGLATLTATLSVPSNPYGRYLNLTAEVAEVPGGVRIQSLRLGSVPLPGVLADWTARLTHRWLRRDETYATLADAFSQIGFDENLATLDYQWHPELLLQIERKSAAMLIEPAEQARILELARYLDELVKPLKHGSTVPLGQVSGPLFEHARQSGGDAAEINRAALTVLAAYLSGFSLPRLLEGDSASIRRAPRALLSLHGRRDFAEHYVISAAITVSGGSRLANAIGLIKEEEDATKGSGFSFTDLAANRAGIRLGERATGDAAAAVLAWLAKARSDAELMPDFRDLPEFMPQAEFDRRFGPVGSERYLRLIGEIDARLDQHALAGKQ